MTAAPLPAHPLTPLPAGVSLGRVLRHAPECLSSGDPVLDRRLGGGFPRGRLSEVFGTTSSGRTSLAHRLLAAATARGEIAALVDYRDRFDPRSAAAAGVSLSRLLWVRPHDEREALRACEILLGTRGIAIVLLDLADGIAPALARRLASVWPRLGHRAKAANVALLLLSHDRLAGSFAALCLELRRGRALWPSHTLRAELFAGIASHAEVVRRRHGEPDAHEALARS